jgi:hypothetical protein
MIYLRRIHLGFQYELVRLPTNRELTPVANLEWPSLSGSLRVVNPIL